MNAIPQTLPQECRKATKILHDFIDPVNGLDRVVPLSVLRRAKGFAIFSVFRIGFIMSARAGSGIVIAKLPDGSWSAPSALGIGGLGGGFNAGAEVTDFLIVLNSSSAVKSFMSTGSLQLGGNLSLAVGPLGRSAEASGAVSSSGKLAAMFSYSKSKGVYAGVSVEGTVLVEREDANVKAYGQRCTSKYLLTGAMEPPAFASSLISTIERFTGTGNTARRDAVGSDEEDDDYEYDGQTRHRPRSALNDLERDFGKQSLGNDRYGSRTSPGRRTSYAFGGGGGNGDPFDEVPSSASGAYAFGGQAGGSVTNSPKRSRGFSLSSSRQNSHQGTPTSGGGVTDYGSSGTPVDSSPTSARSKLPVFSRHKSNSSISGLERGGVQPRKGTSPHAATSTRASVVMANRSAASASYVTRSGGLGFANKFEAGTGLSGSSDEEDDVYGAARSGGYGSGSAGAMSRDASSQGTSARRTSAAALSQTPPADLTSRAAWDPSSDPKEMARLRQREQASQRFYTGDWNLTPDEERRRTNDLDALDRELQGGGGGSGGKSGRGTPGNGVSSSRLSRSSTPGMAPDWKDDFAYGATGLDGTPPPSSSPTSARPSHRRNASSSASARLWNRMKGGSGSASPSPGPGASAASWKDDLKWGSQGRAARGRDAAAIADNDDDFGGEKFDFGATGNGTSSGRGGGDVDYFGAAMTSGRIDRSDSPPMIGDSTPPPSSPSATTALGTSSAATAAATLASAPATAQVVAAFDFQGQDAGDLRLRKGDVIDVLRSTRDRNDWWIGRNVRDGSVGNFPANYTDDL